MKTNAPIDFVVTWVDGSDPQWREEKAKYSSAGSDNRNARFRDWDQLKYWFRAVEKYAPWVNKIHFVTYGHLPQWLNTNHPKLHVVNHKDFIPEKYLPVFNSTAIEIHLHRIPTLSDQFVYFCDDFYLMKPCRPEDFFRNGKPVDAVQLTPIFPHGNEMFYYHLYNDYSIYRNYFRKKDIFALFFKFVNVKYKKAMFKNLMNVAAGNVFFDSLHLPVSFLKSTPEKMWEEHPEAMEKTAASRFRQITNNSPELFRGYQLITGNFHPAYRKGIVVDTREVKRVKEVIESGKYLLMCLSDNSDDRDFENHKEQINRSFDAVLPGRCSFER